MPINLGWVDIGLLAFLSLSILFGLMRGLVFEVLSALGWFVAYFAARSATPLLEPYVHVGDPGSALNHGATFACAFILLVVVWSLGSRLVRLLIRATPLSPIDRLLGAGFGLARGVAVLMALAIAVGLTPLRTAPAWRASEGVVWLQAALQGIKPWLPPVLLQHLPARDPRAV
jgi:membrane protein required for colicin V production